MESMISSLLKRYETGGLTRRDLIQGLALLAAGTAAGSAAAQTEPAPIPWSPFIDHIQINSRDPQRAAEFYQKVMGLELLRVGPAGPNRDCCPDESAFLGVGQRLILAIRRREPYGVIDHWVGSVAARDREMLSKTAGRLSRRLLANIRRTGHFFR